MAASRAILLVALSLVVRVPGQQRGWLHHERGLPLQVALCSQARGCCAESNRVTLDANWRWLHDVIDANERSCFSNGSWVQPICHSPHSCADHCALEGLDVVDYVRKFGIQTAPSSSVGGLKMTFATRHPFGANYGSRVFLTNQNMDLYRMFNLKNREISFTVDVSQLPCGLSGALYFVEMHADGGESRFNQAGAKYGTGYCDAQCPKDVKFGKLGPNTRMPSRGMCCPEVKLWEANSLDAAFTMHICDGDHVHCHGDRACGEGAYRHEGVCDKDGCDYNTYRLGNESYYGHRGTVDSAKPLTVVTQFLTDTGTDSGNLVEVRRVYWQNGKVIPNSHAVNIGIDAADSITDEYCSRQKAACHDVDVFRSKGGLKKLGQALDRGMVLVMSIWDDPEGMVRLDGVTGSPSKPQPGAKRGPCANISSETLRTRYADSSVLFSSIKFGLINSTTMGGTGIPGSGCRSADYEQLPLPATAQAAHHDTFTTVGSG